MSIELLPVTTADFAAYAYRFPDRALILGWEVSKTGERLYSAAHKGGAAGDQIDQQLERPLGNS